VEACRPDGIEGRHLRAGLFEARYGGLLPLVVLGALLLGP
jgi:hypothetical protein